MSRWSNIVVPVLVAVAAGNLVGVGFWDASKQGLLVSLSVIAAGVLVRLARGLPFTTADHYEVDEIRKLTRAVTQIARSLRVLVMFVLAGMFGLVVAKPLLDLALATPQVAQYISYVEGGISAVLAFILSYVFWRMMQVVKGDQDLTELQSAFVVRAVERRQAKRFDEQQVVASSTPFKSPESYGRIIQ